MAGSPIKQLCQFKKCRRAVDVKNISAKLVLDKSQVNTKRCRKMSAKCLKVKFCCQVHLKACKLPPGAAVRKSRGGRAGLDVAQIACLFHVLLDDGCPWAAVLMLLQLFLADRADAARQCQWKWFQGLDPASLNTPSVSVPKVNKKTHPRQVVLFPPFAELLWLWSKTDPLKAKCGQQWPCVGQAVSPENLLFPGWNSTGQKRDWGKAITERAYLGRLHRAGQIIKEHRDAAQKSMAIHPFTDFDLSKLGTHSFKKTSVTLMSQAGVPFSVISAISGTSIKMLQSTYDIATPTRQSSALKTTFSGLNSLGRKESPSASSPKIQYCGWCGSQLADSKHRFCSQCGAKQ